MSLSLFATLPVELHHEIASHSDIDSLSLLSQISRSFYEYYNSFLYQNVNAASLPTLALPQEDRFPLTGPHPATFLRSMRIVGREISLGSSAALAALQDRIETQRLEKEIQAAMVNILKYTPKDLLRSFSFIHLSTSFPKVFTVDSVRALGSLESLAIACWFPRKPVAENEGLSSLCGPSLTRLELEVEMDSYFASTFLQQLPKLCPKLERFVCRFVRYNMIRMMRDFPPLLDSPTFTFPFLVQFSIMLRMECPKSFLQRHPNLQVFRCTRPIKETIDGSSVLPNLMHFTGDAETFLSIFEHGTQAIDRLVLKSEWDEDSAEGLLQYLRRNKTIRHLILQPHLLGEAADCGFDRDTVFSFTASSPNLTTFACSLNIEAAKIEHLNTVYETILGNLPHLEHLKLWFEIDSCLFEKYKHAKQSLRDHHIQAIQSAIMMHDHKTLQSIQLRVYVWTTNGGDLYYGVDSFHDLCFAREVAHEIVSVPKRSMRIVQASGVMLNYGFDDLVLDDL